MLFCITTLFILVIMTQLTTHKNIFFYISALVFLLSACTPAIKHDHVTRGFYYWKTNVALSHFDDSVFNRLDAKVLYIRFFDVVLDETGKGARPQAIARWGKSPLPENIVPVVFITPQALSVINRNNLQDYAEKIAGLLERKTKEINRGPEEIQIDCDWSKSNRDIYFALLEALKRQPYLHGKKLSATIRLYQGKYPALAGLPPVDKGLLMVYNMSFLADENVDNSIISYNTAKDYLGYIRSYPLPLDVALPVFSWTLHFREGKLLRILRGVDDEDLITSENLKKTDKNKWVVRENMQLKGYDLKRGDKIRYEDSDGKTVQRVAQFLSSQMKADTFRVLLYHLDSLNLIQYKKNELEKIFDAF